MTHSWKKVDTDVLVIGGGATGCMATIPILQAALEAIR